MKKDAGKAEVVAKKEGSDDDDDDDDDESSEEESEGTCLTRKSFIKDPSILALSVRCMFYLSYSRLHFSLSKFLFFYAICRYF